MLWSLTWQGVAAAASQIIRLIVNVASSWQFVLLLVLVLAGEYILYPTTVEAAQGAWLAGQGQHLASLKHVVLKHTTSLAYKLFKRTADS
jgi:hypothetical protein